MNCSGIDKSPVLVIAPAWIGDMMMAQTLFMALKALYPESELHVLAPSWTHSLVLRMPEVDKTLLLPIPRGVWGWRLRYDLGVSLRQYHYQLAIILPNSFKSALVPFWAKIPRRVGWRREGRQFILTDAPKLDSSSYPLMVERFLGLVYSQCPPYSYTYPTLAINREVALSVAKDLGLMPDLPYPILALCPGAEYGPAKRWPESHFAKVAKDWIQKGGRVWIVGSQKEESIASHILALIGEGAHSLAGQTNLGQAIDLLSLVKAVVTNDSGLMHIAAALNKPIVALYGSSSPEFTPPLAKHVICLSLKLPCSPCFKRICPLGHLDCLNKLEPQSVIQALEQLCL